QALRAGVVEGRLDQIAGDAAPAQLRWHPGVGDPHPAVAERVVQDRTMAVQVDVEALPRAMFDVHCAAPLRRSAGHRLRRPPPASMRTAGHRLTRRVSLELDGRHASLWHATCFDRVNEPSATGGPT